MTEKRRQYTEECKREAVRMVTERGYGVNETARDLGINAKMLGRWKRQARQSSNGAFSVNGPRTAEQEELVRLRQEVKRLMAREILKNRFVAPARHVWVEKLQPVGYRGSSGRSDRLRMGGSAPVKKPGPGPLADGRVVTPAGAPIQESEGAACPPPPASGAGGG
jgi:transposase